MNWNSSVLWGIISLISTIFFGYVFYKKSVKQKNLYISVDSKILISESLTKYKGLKISYNKKNIKNLVCSTISIENIGNETIDATDIAPSSPITFSTTNKFLLNDVKDYEISITNKNINSSLNKISNSKIEFAFDYLKPKEEILITLLHNGNITINGDLKNGEIYTDQIESVARRNRINIMKKVIIILFLSSVFLNTTAIIILFIIK